MKPEYSSYTRNFPKFSDIQVSANSADPDQTAPRGQGKQFDLGLHCLLLPLHHLQVSNHSRT